MRRGFGQCAMVAPGPRMGGDFGPWRSTEYFSPNKVGWVALGSEPGVRRTGWVASGGFAPRVKWLARRSELEACRPDMDRYRPNWWSWGPRHADRSWAARRRGMRIGDRSGWASRDADRSWGPEDGWRAHRSGTGWVEPGNRRGPTQKVIACVSRGKSSPQRLFLKIRMRH